MWYGHAGRLSPIAWSDSVAKLGLMSNTTWILDRKLHGVAAVKSHIAATYWDMMHFPDFRLDKWVVTEGMVSTGLGSWQQTVHCRPWRHTSCNPQTKNASYLIHPYTYYQDFIDIRHTRWRCLTDIWLHYHTMYIAHWGHLYSLMASINFRGNYKNM